MNTLKAKKRNTVSAGQIKQLRSNGFVPAVLYGGEKNNLNISLTKLHLRDAIKTETFLSKVVDLDIDGSPEKAIPREISYDPVSDEPVHIDFMRIIKGSKLILEIPVRFINSEKSPGLKKGGVLNIVRRKVELKCPAENIPDEIIVDLDNTEINKSLKISSVKLPENVTPTIIDRDFVIATVAAPTILAEPEKKEETEGVEGEAVPAEGATIETTKTDDVATTEESKDKSAKPSDDKSKSAPSDKSKPATKENKKK